MINHRRENPSARHPPFILGSEDRYYVCVVSAPVSTDPSAPREILISRTPADRLYRAVTTSIGAFTFVIMALIAVFLVIEAWPALEQAGWGFFTNSGWTFGEDFQDFGVRSLLYGTVLTAVLAMAFAIPAGVATALAIVYYVPDRVRRALTTMVDLMASIPSLIYGFWGVRVLADAQVPTATWLGNHASFIPLFRTDREAQLSFSYFLASIVLAMMVFPIIVSIVREVFTQVPPGEIEAALALGSTRWGMIRVVALPFARGGIIGGSMLGLGRALGETIAVLYVLSQVPRESLRVLERGGTTIASWIANQFFEATELQRSALLAAGLVLFAFTLTVNLAASVIVDRSRSGAGVEA